MIKIGIIEDDKDIREGIQKYFNFQKDFLCDLACDSVENFFEAVKGERYPDILLMDIGLPGMSGINGMKIIKEREPDTDIIMLTVYTDWNKIFDSICAGASGYLLKNTPLSEIKRSVESVVSGGAAMSPEIARKVMQFFIPEGKSKPDSALTPREREIVVALVDGLSYKMIAGRMNVSIETVRFHIKNIYKKLHVNSKAEVISKSLRGEI